MAQIIPASWVMCGLGLLMIILFIIDRWRMDVVALLILALLGVFDILPTHLLLSGFSSSAVVSIIAVMIIGAGIERTGLMNSVINFSLNASGGRYHRLISILSLFSGFLSGLLRSLGGFALLLPVINRISLYLKIPKSRLLMPIGFSAITGGSITLLGSGALLTLNDILRDPAVLQNGHRIEIAPLGLFTVTPIGISILLSMILFFVFFGRHLLPTSDEKEVRVGADVQHFRQTYGFGGRFFELKIPVGSRVVGMNIFDLECLLHKHKIAVLGLATGKGLFVPPLRKMRLESGHRLAFVGKENAVIVAADVLGLRLLPRLKAFSDILNPMRSGFSEIVIPPGSSLIGQQMNELHMRRNYGVQVLSVFRGEYIQGEDMQQLSIRSGDTLGVYSPWQDLAKLEKEGSFAVVTTDYPKDTFDHSKRWAAVLSLLVGLLLIFVLGMSVAVGLICGAVLMLMLEVVRIEDAYRAISWKTVFLLAGLIPFGIAMQTSGVANQFSNVLMHVLSGFPPWVFLLGLSVMAGIFSLFMTNVGATVVLVPIALHLATALGEDPRRFAIITAIATSNAFIIPTHQVNALIAGPGGYPTRMFVKVGCLASVLYLVVMLLSAHFFL